MGKKKPNWPRRPIIQDGEIVDQALYDTLIAHQEAPMNALKAVPGAATPFTQRGVMSWHAGETRLGLMLPRKIGNLKLNQLCRMLLQAEKNARKSGADMEAFKAVFEPIKQAVRDVLEGNMQEVKEEQEKIKKNLPFLEPPGSRTVFYARHPEDEKSLLLGVVVDGREEWEKEADPKPVLKLPSGCGWEWRCGKQVIENALPIEGATAQDIGKLVMVELWGRRNRHEESGILLYGKSQGVVPDGFVQHMPGLYADHPLVDPTRRQGFMHAENYDIRIKAELRLASIKL